MRPPPATAVWVANIDTLVSVFFVSCTPAVADVFKLWLIVEGERETGQGGGERERGGEEGRGKEENRGREKHKEGKDYTERKRH